MLRKLVNQAEVEMTLQPAEPLLIASGIPSAAGIDLPFVVTYRWGTDTGEPYLPGSSLKGVLRSHAERLSRTLAPRARVCDPHFHRVEENSGSVRAQFCGDRLWRERNGDHQTTESHDLYRKSCPVCRTFGSTMYRGRLAIGDAYLKDRESTFKLERRDGVGIDRFSGGASRGVKFEMEVLTHGTFRVRMRMENFEDWQLGLLALLCRDLEDELVSIGHATTRGLGRLKGTIEHLDVMYIVPSTKPLDDRELRGVGSLLSPEEGRPYGYRSDDRIPLTTAAPLRRRSVRWVQSFVEPAARRTFFDDAVARWSERMESWGKP